METGQDDLISVIVPVYNVKKYLEKCVESIINQTYKHLEIILVDDGSTDQSGILCDECRTRDKRIKVIHKENGGLSDARNAGLDVCSGKYVVFVDSDDFIDKDMVRMLYMEICEGADIALCAIRTVDSSGQMKDEEYRCKDQIVDQDGFWKLYYFENSIYCGVACNKIYPIKFFRDVRYETGRVAEDEYILHQIIDQCGKISCLSYIGYYYMRRSDSITSKKNMKLYLDAIAAHLNRAKYFRQSGKPKWATMAVKGFMYQYYYIGKEYKHLYKEKEVWEIYQNCREFIKKHMHDVLNSRDKMQMLLFYFNFRIYVKICGWIINR